VFVLLYFTLIGVFFSPTIVSCCCICHYILAGSSSVVCATNISLLAGSRIFGGLNNPIITYTQYRYTTMHAWNRIKPIQSCHFAPNRGCYGVDFHAFCPPLGLVCWIGMDLCAVKHSLNNVTNCA
jgi:hypothetical protein